MTLQEDVEFVRGIERERDERDIIISNLEDEVSVLEYTVACLDDELTDSKAIRYNREKRIEQLEAELRAFKDLRGKMLAQSLTLAVAQKDLEDMRKKLYEH